jgi:hypothetical protein
LFHAYIEEMEKTSRPLVVFAFSLLVLTSLAAATHALASEPLAPSEPGKPQVKDRMGSAVLSPFEDLNLIKDKIPLALQEAIVAPYDPPRDKSCEALAAAIAPLTLALGPDLDEPNNKTNPSLLERGSGMAGDVAIDAVRGAAQSLIPFRGWVRKLSGADSYAKLVRAAIIAGGVRRAYLKGLGEAMGCAAPASVTRVSITPPS